MPWWVRNVPGFLVVGACCTAAYFTLYLLLRAPLDAQWANAVALVVSTLADTWGNRRWTFGVRDPRSALPHQLLGLAVLALGVLLTSVSLWWLGRVAPGASTLDEVLVLAAANGLSGTIRFAAYARVMRTDRPARVV